MGKLEDLQNELYRSGGTEPPVPRFFGKPKTRSEDARLAWKETPEVAYVSAPAGPSKKMSRFYWIALGILVLGIVSILGIFFFGFEGEPLRITILVKERAEAGEKVTYRILYKNVGAETLKDAELSFTYPAGAVPLRDQAETGKTPRTRILLSDLPKGREGSVELEARLYGREAEVKKAEVVILYRPEASSAKFISKAAGETTIVRVPIVLTVNAPGEVVSGQIAAVVIDYASNAESVFENVFLGITYPAGFEPISFDPGPAAESSVWSLGSVAPGDSGRITITGKISGAPSEIKTFEAKFGLYNALTKQWTPYQVASIGAQLSTPLLSVEQRINETRDFSLRAGDELRFRVHYKNTLDMPLKNISLEVGLTVKSGESVVDAESVLDFKSLSIERGVYNGTAKRIVWNPASVPEFNEIPPHAEGDLQFYIRTNPLLGIDVDFSSLAIESVAEIKAGQVPYGFEGVDLTSRDSITAKVMAKTVLSSLVLYRNQYLANAGSLPPKVNEKTTYVIFWQLANSLGEVRDAEIIARLSPGASWESRYSPDGSSLSYDSASGMITWRAGSLLVGAGKIKSAPFVAFQVGIAPGPDQVGKSPLLLKDIQVHAQDVFTGEKINFGSPDLTIELRGDLTTSEKDWKVVR